MSRFRVKADVSEPGRPVPSQNGNGHRAPQRPVEAESARRFVAPTLGRNSYGDADPLAVALVIGGAGATAAIITAELMTEGFEVSTMDRQSTPPAGAHAVGGDITDIDSVRAAMSTVDAVVIAIESTRAVGDLRTDAAVHLGGVQHVIAGAPRAGIQIVLVSQAGLADGLAHDDTTLAKWRMRGEQTLRESAMAYTIVNPAELTDEPGRHALRFTQGQASDGQVSRIDVAHTCAQCLLTTASHCKTFAISEHRGPPVLDWVRSLSELVKDEEHRPMTRRREA